MPLTFAVTLTLYEEALWQGIDWGSFETLFTLIVWFVLVVGWIMQQAHLWMNRPRSNGESLLRRLVLPVSVGLVAICALTDAPLRVLFWTHKGALEEALKRPVLERQLHSGQPRIGLFRPLQISKSGKATRFILWENQVFLSGSAVGFAYCPHDAGCSGASFDSFYWDYEVRPKTLQVCDDWVAVSTYGSDF